MYVIVAGGGMVGGGLVRRLLENKHDVVVVEQSKEICDKLYAQTGVIAICGSAKDIEILREAKIKKADAFVAATGDDADNLAASILAKSAGVPEIIVRMRSEAYESAYKEIGVSSILRVTDLMVNQMMMEIEKPEVRKVTSISSGRADIFQVVVPENAKVAGKNVKEIAQNRNFPAQCSFIAVYNKEKEEFSIPRGNQVIREGDELFLVATVENITKAANFITSKSK